ncbi:MAG: AAA family ATPase [Rubrivivax sp.]|nr:AAA family ATPase [Rubrivivax sp.]
MDPSLPSAPSPPRRLRLRLNGAPALAVGEAWLPLERKAAAAVAWLALNGPTPRQRLADLLWPAAGEDAARNSLRQLLFKLKKTAAAAVIEGTERLELAAPWDREPGDGELLAAWRYDDCPQFDRWLSGARTDDERRRLEGALEAIDAALAAGDAGRAGAGADALLAADPLSEAGYLRRVQALYLAGRNHEALDAARRAEQLWHEQLSLAPSPDFVRLRDTVERAAAAGPRSMPVTVLRPPRLVGRRHELALLADARASGRVAVIIGEPGLGKSRLLAEAAGALPGERVLGCRPGDAGVPYGALARWLRSLRADFAAAFEPLPPTLAHVLPESDAPRSARPAANGIANAMAAVLGRAVTSGLGGLAFDDLHFADAASIEALAACLDAQPLASLVWTLARRPAEGSPALDRLADRLLDEDRLLPVTLSPLDEDGMRELVQSLELPGLARDDLAAELWQATGGNPMFALETLKAMLLQPQAPSSRRLPRPPNVAALIERRLKQLSPTALSLARVAALAGPDFDAELAAAVMQMPVLALSDGWRELEAAQVLKDQAFAHDLILEATLASVPQPVQRHARGAMAAHLATRGGEPSRIGGHWLAAGEPGRAAPQFLAAGRRAESAARYGEARELIEQAARCHDTAGDPAAAFDARLALADLLMEGSEFTAAHEVLDAMATQPLDADGQVRVAMQRMQVLARTDATEEATKLGRAMLEDPAVLEDAAAIRIAQLRWTLAMTLRTTGGGEAALEQLALAEPLLARSPDASWRSWFHSQCSMSLLILGRIGEAARAQEQAILAAREVGRHRMLAGCLQNGSTLSTQRGRLVEALGELDECLLLMADTGGGDAFTQHVRVQRARLLVWLGRYRDALAALEPLAHEAGLAEYNRGRTLASLLEVWTHLGQAHRARQVQAQLAAVQREPFERQVLALVEEEVGWLGGRAAAPELAAVFAAERTPSVPNLALARLLSWRRHGITDAEELRREAQALRGNGMAGHAAAASALAAASAARAGDAQDVRAEAQLALQALRTVSPPGLYRPWLFLTLAEATAGLDAELHARSLREGAQWVRNVARFQVPPAFRTGFLNDNRINRQLLALAGESG